MTLEMIVICICCSSRNSHEAFDAKPPPCHRCNLASWKVSFAAEKEKQNVVSDR